MGPSRTSQTDYQEREKERHSFRERVAVALTEEDDPLALYQEFIQWTVDNYGENDPQSGLLELLREATGAFKGDPVYKTDLRYLKFWSLYARQVQQSDAIEIYAYLLGNNIGTTYSTLYEEYAALLEKCGRLSDAEIIYRNGIKRQVRPLERLKSRFRDFQSRSASSSALPPIPSQSKGSLKPSADGSRLESRNTQARSASSPPPPTSKTSPFPPTQSTAESRYAVMLAPPGPGKRPEKFRCNLSLLFTDDGVEYSIQEARARSLGLLGKKWGPPPISETRFASSSLAPVDFNDDGQKSTRLMALGGRRKSLMAGTEPTVTINTKEALADVFGMYNSPEKTSKFMPGSKHAPLRKIDAITPVAHSKLSHSHSNENASQNAKTPTAAFRPLVGENNRSSRTTPAPPAKFTPFVDENSSKVIFTTPRPILSLKEAPTSTPRANDENPSQTQPSKSKSIMEDPNAENVFAKVFTPAQAKPPPLAPLRDVFTDDHGKPQMKAKHVFTHERAKSHHDVSSSADEGLRPTVFTPITDENSRTPFKVFSRPSEQNESHNVFTPKTPAFTPFVDTNPKPAPAFTPFRDNPARTFTPFVDNNENKTKPPIEVASSPAEPAPTWSNTVVEIEDDDEQEQEQEQEHHSEDEYDERDESYHEYETPIGHGDGEYEGEMYQEVPLGGRFGQFNVMTPITERTVEYTSTRSAFGGTPSDHRSAEDGGSPRSQVFRPPNAEAHAMRTAEQLAAELREGGSSENDEPEEVLEPLRLSDNSIPRRDPPVAVIQEKTGSLSLLDTLTLNSQFNPPNPCNPFDPPIMATLLLRIPSDPQYIDLRNKECKSLDNLQKWAKKSRKTNGNSGLADVGSCYSLNLNGHRFIISEKLGEGGFGAVFKAQDRGIRDEDADDGDDEDEDDDEDNTSMVAIKIVKPRNIWEYHVLRRLHSTLPQSLRRSLIMPYALYAFRDESFLILDLCTQGTLLNTVNNANAAGISQQGACLDELLVMFFAIELLRLLEGMHTAGLIHGDLKIDNCLLRLEEVPGGSTAWGTVYQPSGAEGWACKGLKVIDFGRTVDTRLFPPGQQFIAEWPTDDRDCFEIREDRPWTYQTDYFGLAGIVYCMLFGKYIQAAAVVTVDGGDVGPQRYRIGTPFKRYWQTELWGRLFDLLLNSCLVRPGGDLPICAELGMVRGEMEAWLQANCTRTSNTLKGLLKKVEMSCLR